MCNAVERTAVETDKIKITVKDHKKLYKLTKVFCRC